MDAGYTAMQQVLAHAFHYTKRTTLAQVLLPRCGLRRLTCIKSLQKLLLDYPCGLSPIALEFSYDCHFSKNGWIDRVFIRKIIFMLFRFLCFWKFYDCIYSFSKIAGSGPLLACFFERYFCFFIIEISSEILLRLHRNVNLFCIINNRMTIQSQLISYQITKARERLKDYPYTITFWQRNEKKKMCG